MEKQNDLKEVINLCITLHGMPLSDLQALRETCREKNATKEILAFIDTAIRIKGNAKAGRKV